jgi:hypothetical protein
MSWIKDLKERLIKRIFWSETDYYLEKNNIKTERAYVLIEKMLKFYKMLDQKEPENDVIEPSSLSAFSLFAWEDHNILLRINVPDIPRPFNQKITLPLHYNLIMKRFSLIPYLMNDIIFYIWYSYYYNRVVIISPRYYLEYDKDFFEVKGLKPGSTRHLKLFVNNTFVLGHLKWFYGDYDIGSEIYISELNYEHKKARENSIRPLAELIYNKDLEMMRELDYKKYCLINGMYDHLKKEVKGWH